MSEESIQAEQKSRYENWVRTEGGVEQKVHEETYKEPAQQERTKWLIENTRDVPALLSGHKDILELGVSGGHQLIAVNGRAGVDVNKNVILDDRMMFPTRIWKTANVTQGIPFRDGEFHTVLIPDILEHVWFNQALGIIREARRVSKKRILITIPDGREQGKNEREVCMFKHRWILTKPKLEELLKVCMEDKQWEVLFDTVGPFVCVRMNKK